ncbi:MAG: radical SAM protein [Fervidicoccaceae archaeon]
MKKVIILDGYTDEPAGLGVPPFIDVYPRYIAGAIWSSSPDTKVIYYTIDEARKNFSSFYSEASTSEITVVIAGVVVPGKYIGGRPITPEEVKSIGMVLNNTFTVLVGPAARFGMGEEGGKPAISPSSFKNFYGAVVSGDPEIYISEVMKLGVEKVDVWVKRKSYDEVNRFATVGAKIVRQHPNYAYNLTAEIETYRGCSRWIVGGCSFCIEPLYGKPVVRPPEKVIEEVRALYSEGIRSFRIGRQPDILSYGSTDLGVKENPEPNPEFLDYFFKGLREAAGNSNIHVDNANPSVISSYPEKSKKAILSIMKYHSPGDVLAFGVESADEEVVEMNNLNVTFEDAVKAVEVVNEVGRAVGENGLPHILPGINFVLGLPGERAKTYERNLEFLDELLRRKLMVRRINIRRVLVIPGTRLHSMWKESILSKNEERARRFIWLVRHKYDPAFLRMVVPPGAILRNLYVERSESWGNTYARQLGSYPIMVELRGRFNPPCILDAKIVGYKGRSLKGVPVSQCRTSEISPP